MRVVGPHPPCAIRGPGALVGGRELARSAACSYPWRKAPDPGAAPMLARFSLRSPFGERACVADASGGGGLRGASLRAWDRRCLQQGARAYNPHNRGRITGGSGRDRGCASRASRPRTVVPRPPTRRSGRHPAVPRSHSGPFPGGGRAWRAATCLATAPIEDVHVGTRDRPARQPRQRGLDDQRRSAPPGSGPVEQCRSGLPESSGPERRHLDAPGPARRRSQIPSKSP